MVDLAAAETPPRAAALLLGELTPDEVGRLALSVLRAEGETDERLLREVIADAFFCLDAPEPDAQRNEV
jgi:hypothetical protein